MENKQTVVDFLEESIHLHCLIDDSENVIIDYNTLDKLFMKAKAMEKEQIKDAHLIGLISSMEMEATKQAEQYYQENYGTPVDKKG